MKLLVSSVYDPPESFYLQRDARRNAIIDKQLHDSQLVSNLFLGFKNTCYYSFQNFLHLCTVNIKIYKTVILPVWLCNLICHVTGRRRVQNVWALVPMRHWWHHSDSSDRHDNVKGLDISAERCWCKPNVVAEWLILLLRIREVPDPYLTSRSAILAEIFCRFPQYLKANDVIVP
jgi:hypothetical protein